jgi:hypothetical protein
MLEKSCAEHLRHERRTWRVFARSTFAPLRSTLLRLADTLQLEAATTSRELLSVIEAVSTDVPPYSDYYCIADVTPAALPREWRSLVLADPSDPGAFNRKQLEVVAILELAAAIQAGEMFVAGSLSYDRLPGPTFMADSFMGIFLFLKDYLLGLGGEARFALRRLLSCDDSLLAAKSKWAAAQPACGSGPAVASCPCMPG